MFQRKPINILLLFPKISLQRDRFIFSKRNLEESYFLKIEFKIKKVHEKN